MLLSLKFSSPEPEDVEYRLFVNMASVFGFGTPVPVGLLCELSVVMVRDLFRGQWSALTDVRLLPGEVCYVT